MIDEEGRPRPIKVKIEAGITIDGQTNVVGEKAIEAVRHGLARGVKRRMEADVEEGQGQPKKRRAMSETQDRDVPMDREN